MPSVFGPAKETTSVEVFPAHSSPRAKFVTLKMPFHGLFLVFWCLNLVAREELWRQCTLLHFLGITPASTKILYFISSVPH